MAQLVEQSHLTPEVLRSNQGIGKLLYRTFICILSTVLKIQLKRKKRPGMAHSLKYRSDLGSPKIA